MNSIKKICSAVLSAIFIVTAPNVTSAEDAVSTEATSKSIREFSAEGEYRLGDNDNRTEAKIKALADAKRKIVEQIGVYVQTYSELNKSELTTDLIRTASIALIKVKSENVEFSENGTLCRVFITADANVDDDHIAEVIKKIIDPDLIKESPDEKLLKVAKIWKYGKHYYKMFDESLTWRDADNRCKGLGGHLVTITTKDEQAAIQNMIFYYTGKKNYYWTGGFTIMNDVWEWATGEDFTYTNWADGEPNNDLGNEFILALHGNTGKWSDCPSDGINHIPDVDFFKLENSGFICEWDNYDDIKI